MSSATRKPSPLQIVARVFAAHDHRVVPTAVLVQALLGAGDKRLTTRNALVNAQESLGALQRAGAVTLTEPGGGQGLLAGAELNRENKDVIATLAAQSPSPRVFLACFVAVGVLTLPLKVLVDAYCMSIWSAALEKRRVFERRVVRGAWDALEALEATGVLRRIPRTGLTVDLGCLEPPAPGGGNYADFELLLSLDEARERLSGPPRGFAAMDQTRRRELARAAGRAAHKKGVAYKFNSEAAELAGRKGGETASRDRAHMAAIGRKGGHARASDKVLMAELGRKGGHAVSQDRDHMKEIGRKGGKASRGARPSERSSRLGARS